MKVAIIGLEQSGKKTLFSLLTGKNLNVHIKKDEFLEGIAKIGDYKVDQLSKLFNPKKTTYAEINYLLCPHIKIGDDSLSWPDKLKGCDLICLVLREFDSKEIYHPLGNINSQRDKEHILIELIMSDLDLIEKRIERLRKEKSKKKSPQIVKLEHEALQKCKEKLEREKMLSELSLTNDEWSTIHSLNLITNKPILFCYNVSEDQIAADNPSDNKDNDKNIFHISAQIEKEIMEIEDKDERDEYLHDLGISQSGIDRLNSAAYNFLGLMSFYTVGKDEVRAWAIKKGTNAQKAGGKIHSDIEKGFIRVEVIKYDDLIKAGSEQVVKSQGKFQLKGKEYIMENGDICHFLFNV